MNVEYIDHMGTDVSVVNAARVSFGKKVKRLSTRDKKLIGYLAAHEHWTPFAHTAITVHVSAPMFVARQLAKHQIGLVWNEISRRYVDSNVTFYLPPVWREKADDKKQGSGEGTVNTEQPDAFMDQAIDYYNKLIASNVAPELARMVLPQAMNTEWYWSGSLFAFSRVCKLRIADDAQAETRTIARQISNICEELFPISWKELQEKGNN
jgi:thymidylate synthase (FAD)